MKKKFLLSVIIAVALSSCSTVSSFMTNTFPYNSNFEIPQITPANKEFSMNLENQIHIKKLIIYTKRTTINLDSIENINFSKVDIDIETSDLIAVDNIFNSNSFL